MKTPYENAYKLACEKLAGLDLEDVAFNSSARLEDGAIYLDLMGETFAIKEHGSEITVDSGGAHREPSINEKIILLHYLITADGSALKGEEITLQEIPGASFYYPTYKARTIDLIISKFSHSYDKLIEVAQSIGFKAIKAPGSCRLKSLILPNVPVSFILWLPADAGGTIDADSLKILYDAGINHYLPLEDIIILTELIAHKIVKASE